MQKDIPRSGKLKAGRKSIPETPLASLTTLRNNIDAIDREILEQGRREGVLRHLDPHAAHLSLIGSIVFFLVSQPLRDRSGELAGFPAESPTFDDYFDHVKQLFLTGFKTQTRETR